MAEAVADWSSGVAAMEACGGLQRRARRLRGLDHEPMQLPAKAVRPFVTRNKNDAHDARAIWTARTVWALLAHDRAYQADVVSQAT